MGRWAAQQSPTVVGLAYLALALGIVLASIAFYRLVERHLHRGFRRVLGVR
jgi:hypothetical protein